MRDNGGQPYCFKNLDDFNRKFWKALLPVTSYRFVPLTEQIEKYCCGLPKGLRKYCTKTKVTTLTQLVEVANTGNGLLKGEDSEFNTGVKEGSAKKNSAKKYVLNEVPRATQERAKAWKGKAMAEPAKGPAKKWKKPFSPCKSGEQRQVLRTENICFICEQLGHFASSCPQKKRPADFEDKEDRKGKRPMAGLVPDMVGDKPNSDASELCRAWGKVRDQTVLIFFDPGAKANFISPELASKLGIRFEEMGYTAEAAFYEACLLPTEQPFNVPCLASDLPLVPQQPSHPFKIGMRWRAEKEVISGKGQFVCGSRKCDAKDDLSSYEVNFTYREAGENKQALVKLRVCPGCGEKLNYKRDRDRETLKQIPDRDKKRLKSEERPRKNEKRGKKRCIADVQQSSESKADMCDQIHLAGGSSLSPSSTGDGVTQITSQEEEYDKYFKGMFP
ncbi:hypothetical protein L7F22_026541 [Adiantum nelumboides]|nr:hypothetical protein [Adiantum nelumboides]